MECGKIEFVPPLRVVRQYLVRISYREPTYELYTGRTTPKHYRVIYELTATTEQNAVSQAIAEFKHITSLSSVGWQREIVDVQVEEIRKAS